MHSDIEKIVEEFDAQFVPMDWLLGSAGEKPSNDRGSDLGVAKYHTDRIKRWLRSALSQAHNAGYELGTLQEKMRGDDRATDAFVDGKKVGYEEALEKVTAYLRCLEQGEAYGGKFPFVVFKGKADVGERVAYYHAALSDLRKFVASLTSLSKKI